MTDTDEILDTSPDTEVSPHADDGRAAEIAAAYAAIRAEIEVLRGLDLGETHPAVIFRPIARQPGR
ncbi:hypothetical protein EDC22_1222 [Tepidamorphus gemmatus]|uniref:Uncharacterized protein n=1 Tax=Tepidamorphus gemmatus TaxID=747076 RepID=A0A4R3LR82_9HYPH|nr:hypothetical protein [Tepidamorphus gemmatus]TCT03023.1 hypothetical protein EDC22_1222 [Tepidamorphus gemmatus]